MDLPGHVPDNPDYTIRDSARDSVRFAHRCLEPTAAGRWRARSSFVDPSGEIMHWHDFGDLEGPGWAANAMGGATLLYLWARFDRCHLLEHVSLGLADHVLDDGFVQADGLIAGYRCTDTDRLCLNYKHNDEWFCPGSMALVALQMLRMADMLGPSDRATRLVGTADRATEWLLTHVEAGANGWYPRRIRPDGTHFPGSPEGPTDPFAYGSADGLYLIWLLLEQARRGHGDLVGRASAGLARFTRDGGIYGSINHDTYDADECVARAVACRVALRAAEWLHEPVWLEFAAQRAMPGLQRFLMTDDRNGVATTGLLRMEDSWDTAYLWENAEVALAYLEMAHATGDPSLSARAVHILRAIAKHHHGDHGFLTEGVDWNNHVGREHHIDGAEFAAIRYTEPLLNNLNHIEPAMVCLAGTDCGD